MLSSLFLNVASICHAPRPFGVPPTRRIGCRAMQLVRVCLPPFRRGTCWNQNVKALFHATGDSREADCMRPPNLSPPPPPPKMVHLRVAVLKLVMYSSTTSASEQSQSLL